MSRGLIILNLQMTLSSLGEHPKALCLALRILVNKNNRQVHGWNCIESTLIEISRVLEFLFFWIGNILKYVGIPIFLGASNIDD